MRWSPAADQVLTELRAKGMTFGAIAKHLDDTRSAVCNRARRLGLPTPKPILPEGMAVSTRKRVWSEAEDDRIREGVAVGLSYDAIADRIGVSRPTVASRAYTIGIRREQPFKPTRADRFVCGHCGTRSDAALDFGCGQCLPLRRVAA